MNVLKADFMSKQKRLQSRRQKVLKTFFSGYHTISNAAPAFSFLKLPRASENRLRSLVGTSDRLPTSICQVEESVVPKSFGISSHDASTSKSEGVENLRRLHDKKDSSSSTSLEFRRLLEPFQSHRQSDYLSTSDECFEARRIFPNIQGVEKDFTFQNEESGRMKRGAEGKQTPSDALRLQSSAFSKETFQQYNIFNLSVPRNQKSIEEVLSEKTTSRSTVLPEHVQSPSTKRTRHPAWEPQKPSEVKTPKNRIRKSPRVSGSTKTVSSDSGAFILAVTEGRGQARGEVGIAAMDPRRPHLVLCQISDSQKYVHSLAKMNVFDFVEVIVPNTFVDCPTPNKLYCDIRSTFPKVTLTSVQRRHFKEAMGVDLIRQYCSSESTSVMVLLRDKFYALAAAAALIKYIEFTQNVRLAPQTLRIEYQGTEDTMIIDLNTANLLELVLCANHPETNLRYSLLGVVRYCHTKGGVRLLRANILQPPCSLAKIETRLDCVTELVNNPLLMCVLEAAVSSFSNAEDLLNLCMHAPQQDGLRVAEYQLKYTLLLKSMLELLPTLRTSLQDAKSPFFCSVRENLEDHRYTLILNRILQTVFENAKTVKGSVSAHLHGCFAIKMGINSLLDVAKKTYCEIVQEISDHVSELREKHDMPLRLAFSAQKGFHIQYTLPPGQRNLTESSLPKEFILVQKSKTTFSFYTTELVALDQRSQHVLNEIKLMTNVILFELLTDIRQHIGCLFNLCEYIAELDVLISFAHVSSGTNYVRPRFGDEFNLRDSRHPILDVVYDGEVVPNDASARPGKNFTILTGPNQSGKSIYIRQIALLQIMAQIGCYVPAREATFRLTDRIFSRIGFDDSIESNASTLMVEMRDIEYLKQNVTGRSLVIIDELCRGTSVDEGTSLAFAICEELLDTSAFIFFTTHYLLLTKLEDMYFNVANYHFETKVETTPAGKPSVIFTHLRREGVTTSDLYGLLVAEMTSFPKDVYAKAKLISARLSEDRKVRTICVRPPVATLEAMGSTKKPLRQALPLALFKPCREVNGLLAEYGLSLRFREELVKCEREMSWQRMTPIIDHFKQLHGNLKKGKLPAEEYENQLFGEEERQLECLGNRCRAQTRTYRPRDRTEAAQCAGTELAKGLSSGGVIASEGKPNKAIRELALRIRQKYMKLGLNPIRRGRRKRKVE